MAAGLRAALTALLLFAVPAFVAPRATWAQQVSHPVGGPATSTLNEITSWNNATGNLIKQGFAQLTDNKTAAITADAAALTAFSRSGYTASQILSWAFTASGCPAPCTGTTYDALRAVAHVPDSTSVNLTNGIGAYVISEVATNPATGFPTGNGLFATVIANATNAKVWGVNTLLTDTITGAVSAGTGKSLNNEFDFNVTSPSTTVLGLQLAGSSLAQPASAIGIALQPLDAPLFGTVARWTVFLSSTEGATNTFASVGAKQHTGASIKSQDINLNFKTSTGADAAVVLLGAEAGGLEVFSDNALSRAVTITGGSGRFSVDDGGGFTINNRIVLQGTGANFGVGASTGFTTQTYGNAASATAILGASIALNTLPVSAGGGGLAVCVDAAGVLYKKAACP